MGSAGFKSLWGHPRFHTGQFGPALLLGERTTWGRAQSRQDPVWEHRVPAAHPQRIESGGHGRARSWQDGQDLRPVWSSCAVRFCPHERGDALHPLPSTMPGCAQPCGVPTRSPLEGQHFSSRGHWTQPRGSCPTEGVCWAAPVHPTSLGAGGQGWTHVPGTLSGALLNSGCNVGGGQGPWHCLTSGLWDPGNPHSRASWGGGMAGLAMGWGPGCSLTSGTPTFGGSHPQHRGCHHRSPPASPCCDVRRRETEARPGCAGWGHAAPRSPWFRGSPTRGQRGPAGAPPPFALGLLGGPAQPRPPLPSASSLPGSGGDGHGTRAGWGGEGKGKRWDYGGGTQ